jgi:IS30 family transposase
MPKQGCKRLSYEERKRIESMLNNGYSVTFIANALNKTYQTIYFELKRCKSCSNYSAGYAQQDYIRRNEGNGRKPLLEIDENLAQYISKLILEESLSPVEIINRLRSENYSIFPSSKTTIYAAIDGGLIPSVTRQTLLLKRKKTHMFSNGLIKIPRWICNELDLKDNEDLDINIVDGKIVIKKSEEKR